MHSPPNGVFQVIVESVALVLIEVNREWIS